MIDLGKIEEKTGGFEGGCLNCIDGVRKEGEIASCFWVPLWVRIPLSQKEKQ